jgi:hypothetical protein
MQPSAETAPALDTNPINLQPLGPQTTFGVAGKSGRQGQKVGISKNYEDRRDLPDGLMTAAGAVPESARRSVLPGIVFLVLVLVTQWAVGAYRAEQGIDSDDAAHFMNGLLVRDYVTEGLGQHPIAFAKEYYTSYPKIAPGMWPPLFHVILGVALLPPWPAHGAALAVLALFAAWAAWRLYRIITLFASRPTGFLLGALFVSTPIVIALTTSIVLDVVVAALALEATFWLAVFLRSAQWRHAALFGVFTALCCLTKGNGISLVIAPLVAILLTGRYDLLRRPGLYVSAAIVVVVAVPVLALTFQLDAAIGDFAPVTFKLALTRLGYYCAYLWTELGPSAAVFAVIGLVESIRRGRRWQEDAPLPLAQAMTALVAGSFIFHLLNPHLLASGRYLTLAIAPLYALAAIGLLTAGRFIAGKRELTIRAALVGVLFVTTFYARPELAVRKPFGYHEMVNELQTREPVAGTRMLIVSDEGGEGALVADVATRRLEPRPVILRGSKLLGTDNWNGHNFEMRFSSTQAVVQELEDLHVAYLVIDSSPDAVRVPYWGLMKQLVESHDDRVQLEFQNTVDSRSGPTRPLALYRVKYQSPGAPKPPPVGFSAAVRQRLKR